VLFFCPVVHISSRQNAIVGRYRSAARGGHAALLLLDGTHLVDDALAAGIGVQQAVVAAHALERHDIAALTARLDRAGVEVLSASAPVMNAVSPVQSASVIVALANRPPDECDRVYRGRHALVVIAADVQDPGNVGAIVRVAEAGGASGVVAAGQSADPFGWKALRGSMGSALRLPVASQPAVERAVAEARRRGCRVVATVPRGGRSLYEAGLHGPLAMLIGGEGAGLPPAVVAEADERVTIPMEAPVESLNASVTAALLVYEARRQRRQA
jgi:TrmH family RNA methyltransferase